MTIPVKRSGRDSVGDCGLYSVLLHVPTSKGLDSGPEFKSFPPSPVTFHIKMISVALQVFVLWGFCVVVFLTCC